MVDGVPEKPTRSSNVGLESGAVGISPPTAYPVSRNDPGFAAVGGVVGGKSKCRLWFVIAHTRGRLGPGPEAAAQGDAPLTLALSRAGERGQRDDGMGTEVLTGVCVGSGRPAHPGPFPRWGEGIRGRPWTRCRMKVGIG